MAANNSATWIVYQPLIVGLGAVVLATIGNTLLEWFRQHLTNKHRATALRRALLEELRVFQESLDLNLERTHNPYEDGSFLIPVSERYRVYDNSIGILAFWSQPKFLPSPKLMPIYTLKGRPFP